MDFESVIDRDSRFEHLLGDGAEEVSPFENVLGEIEPVEVTVPKVKPKPRSILDIQMEGMEASLGMSEEEFNTLETDPYFSTKFKQEITETLSGYAELAKNPMQVIKGAGEFIMSLPGFVLGVMGAAHKMSKNVLDQVILGEYFNLEELYNAASEGMEEGAAFMEPGKEFVFGKPTKESELVGATAMAPVLVLSALGHKVAGYEGFEDYPNIRGAAKFAGDIGGIVALGRIYRGPSKAKVTAGLENVTRKAENIMTREELLKDVPDKAVKKAQERILEVEKKQLELEVADLKKELDVEKALKVDLKEKGRKVKEVKAEEVVETKIEDLKEVPKTGKKKIVIVEKKAKPPRPKPKPEVEFKKFFDDTTTDIEYYDRMLKEGEAEIVYMSPKEYLTRQAEATGRPPLELTPEMQKDWDATISKYKDRMLADEKAPMPVIDYLEKTQEGRARAKAAELAGAKEIPVVVRREPITEVDIQTGVKTPKLESEQSPFFQTKEESDALAKVYADRKVTDIEVAVQKLVNDVNRSYHGDKSININKVRDDLSEFAARAQEFDFSFDNPADFRAWRETVSEAATWARRVEKTEGITLSMGIPVDKASKLIIDSAKRFKGYVEYATGTKKFKPKEAAKIINLEFKRRFVDRSGNIRLDLLDKLGDEGYRIIQKMYLAKGSSSLAANMLQQMKKEVYGGLSKAEKGILDKVILADRMSDIGKYKSAKQFKYPKGLEPVETAAYLELFQHLEKLSSEQAGVIKTRARAYFEWMKKPLKDQLEAGLITQKEYDALVAHNYRRIKLVDIFDKRYQSKIGKGKRTVYDSGVETLAKGRETDIFEPSSEIMALEVFNRAYGRVLNNEANLALFDLAKRDSRNPFVRTKEAEGSIPSGWQRIFLYDKGERKAIYLSPKMSREWITNNPDISYRLGQFLRVISGSPILRTFATGINWAFALANLPRDVMHSWYAARTFDGKEWKSLYSNHLPIFLPQIGADLARTFPDAVTRGKRYQEYIKEGGGMEFLVHQGRIFSRGRKLEGPLDKVQDFMGYFGETSEIMTRLAIRDRVIRRRAKEEGITFEEARKNKKITTEATFAARDYMDFGQGGGITKAADNAFPYLNAAVQGTRGLWRSAIDDPATFGWKTAQVGAVTTLIYAAMREQTPNTSRDLRGSTDMKNNLCIPLPESFGFEDEQGQMRYPYIKVPLDPGQKFFKTFFEAAYDKLTGHEVDVDRVVDSLKEQSPVGVTEMPPNLSGILGYVTNKDFWMNEDIWRKTDKPFKWPESKEEYIPGDTPQAYIDVGKATGLSPERLGYTVEELTTGGTLWSHLLGKGYEALFAEVPKEMKEQHLAMILSEMPIAKRFIGITHPYSKHAAGIDEAQQKVDLEYWVQKRELDRLVEGHLFEGSVDRGEIVKYIKSFKELDVRDRLTERFDFQKSVRHLTNRSFWLRLRGLKTPARAEVYYKMWKNATPERREEISKELKIVSRAGGVLSDNFWDELRKIRREKE